MNLELTKRWLQVQAIDPAIDRKTLWRVRTADGQLRPCGGTEWYIAQAIAEELRGQGVECEVYDQGRQTHRRAVRGQAKDDTSENLW